MKGLIIINPYIIYTNGRFDLGEGVRLAWSGCTITFKFYGTGVRGVFKSTGNDYFIVKVDEVVTNKKLNIKDYTEVDLVKDLPLDVHTIELIKRTEYNIGCTELIDLIIYDGEIIVSDKVQYDLKIEFIGDSISAGYGVDSTEFSTEEVLKLAYDPQYDNAADTYCFLTAKALNAEYHIIACSGHGLIRNYNDNQVPLMPEMLDKITPLSTELWDFHKWIPDMVVINLGTNDFSVGYIPDKEPFVKAYIELIKRLKVYYQNTKFICTVGPCVTGKSLTHLSDYVQEVVNYFKQNNDNKVYYLEYPHHTYADGYGVSYHPSKKTHKKMAELLINRIKEIL